MAGIFKMKITCKDIFVLYLPFTARISFIMPIVFVIIYPINIY